MYMLKGIRTILPDKTSTDTKYTRRDFLRNRGLPMITSDSRDFSYR